jgi:hypothetical protein
VNQSVDHPDISLPHGWHLNPARVSVPPAPLVGLRLDAEMHHRIRNLPQSPREDRQYRNKQFWYDFLNWEHTARRRITCHKDIQPWGAHDIAKFPPTRKTRMTRTTTSS